MQYKEHEDDENEMDEQTEVESPRCPKCLMLTMWRGKCNGEGCDFERDESEVDD